MNEPEKKPQRRTFLRRFVWTVAILVTLTVLFYTVERWRGARAWAKMEAYLKEQGETLEFSELRPARIKDIDNFCAIPLLASVVDFEVKSPGGITYNHPEMRDRFLQMAVPNVGGVDQPELPNVAEGLPVDLRAWADYLAAAEVFDAGDASGDEPAQRIRDAFARFDADFEEIAAAAESRPGARFPIEIGDTFVEMIISPMPHGSDIMGFSKFLTVKGAAAAASGDPGTARKCIAIQLKLADAIGAEPFLIHHLIANVITSQAVSVIWEGLRAEAWDETDLRWILGRLDKIDLFAGGARALREEMTGMFVRGTKFLKAANSHEWSMLVGMTGESSGYVLAWLIPDGWLDQNAAKGCGYMYEHTILPMKNRDLSNVGKDPFLEEFGSATPYNFLVRLLVPAVSSVIKKTAENQTMLDCARVACALELHRIGGGGYPESLEALTPRLLTSIPVDPMTKEPLIYKGEGEGFLVYSVGLNREDDGGVIVRDERGKRQRDRGDWVWIGWAGRGVKGGRATRFLAARAHFEFGFSSWIA